MYYVGVHGSPRWPSAAGRHSSYPVAKRASDLGGYAGCGDTISSVRMLAS